MTPFLLCGSVISKENYFPPSYILIVLLLFQHCFYKHGHLYFCLIVELQGALYVRGTYRHIINSLIDSSSEKNKGWHDCKACGVATIELQVPVRS